MRWAQSGNFAAITGRVGVSRTKAAQRFVEQHSNAWLATMAPSTAGVAAMRMEVVDAIGLGDVRERPQQIADCIMARAAGRRDLIIVDEAQELSVSLSSILQAPTIFQGVC